MKKLALIITSLLVGTSAFAGGVSGGGGNSKPAHPVTKDEVWSMAQDARMYTMFYFNYLERMREWNKGPITDKLFNGPVSITQKILEVPVTLELGGPCLDPEGNEMDGSAIATGKQSICLSIPRLTEKLSQESLRSQTFALLAHEYSHLVGTTEAEADEVQEKAIKTFIYGDYHSINESMRHLITFRDYEINFLKSTPENLEKIGWADLSEIIDGSAYRQVTEGSQMARDFTLLPESMRDAALTVNARYELLDAAVCVLANAEGKENCQQTLDKVFRGDAEISYPTYLARKGWNDDAKQYAQVKYRRVTDKESARIELERLLADVIVLENYIVTLRGY